MDEILAFLFGVIAVIIFFPVVYRYIFNNSLL
ncbi:hypothetical protein C7972_13110 [Arenibacter sp. ARW7G5Y1]|nr:hypothetical protein C7972_13110 [Arenibacter sp. ARW7G5Y1]